MISINKTMNVKALTDLFGVVPDFIGSELMDIQIKYFNRTMYIRIMTTQEVQKKPKRWDEWDVIYIDFSLCDIRQLNISGDVIEGSIRKFDLMDFGNECFFELICKDGVSIKSKLDWMRVENIKPGLIGQP